MRTGKDYVQVPSHTERLTPAPPELTLLLTAGLLGPEPATAAFLADRAASAISGAAMSAGKVGATD